MTPLVAACAAVTMLATTSAGQGTEGGRIQGVWEQITTLTDCAGHPIRSFPVMLTFHQGGTMMDGPATPPALRTPGQGVWRLVGGNTYAYRFKFFTFNTSNVFTGWTIIAGTTTVNSTGDTNAGSATVKVYNTSGFLLVSLCASTAGTRFKL